MKAVQIAFIVPELPEVEHARRTLSTWLAGARIDAIHVQDARILEDGVTPARVARALEGTRRRAESAALSSGSLRLHQPD